jgi:hypothetical protein
MINSSSSSSSSSCSSSSSSFDRWRSLACTHFRISLELSILQSVGRIL